MSRILRTTRALEKETILISPFLELDGQGMPSYGTPLEVEANVLFQRTGASESSDDYVVTAAGTKVMTPLILYVVGDAPYLPVEQDLAELGSLDPRRWVVARRTEPRGLRYQRTQLDHVRLQCRVE